ERRPACSVRCEASWDLVAASTKIDAVANSSLPTRVSIVCARASGAAAIKFSAAADVKGKSFADIDSSCVSKLGRRRDGVECMPRRVEQVTVPGRSRAGRIVTCGFSASQPGLTLKPAAGIPYADL